MLNLPLLMGKSEVFVYCNICNKKVKASILTKHEKLPDNSKRYGMVRIIQHDSGLRTSCANTAQVKALVESDDIDDNGVMV